MDCLHPLAPSNEDLLRFALDDEALPSEASKHLAQCHICQQRLAAYKEANAFLVSHLYRSQCPGGSELSYYCAGLLSPEIQLGIAAHVRDCPLCAEEVTSTRLFMREPLLPPQPQPLMRRVFGTLIRQQAQLVVRGDAALASWPRQYRAENIDLSLHLSRASNGDFILLGIITSTDSLESVDAFEGVSAELYKQSAVSGTMHTEDLNQTTLEIPLLRTQVDDLGNIVFNAVPRGEYSLVVRLSTHEVIVDGLHVATESTNIQRASP